MISIVAECFYYCYQSLLSVYHIHFCTLKLLYNFAEHVTIHRKPKPNFSDLVPQYAPYKPTFIGNILFNGNLVKANSSYGCFMTLNSTNPQASQIPHNLRVCDAIFLHVEPQISSYKFSCGTF